MRVIEELDRLASRRHYRSIRVETFPTQTAVRAALETAGFRTDNEWFGERESRLVPLAASDDALLARMKPKGRYNVRVAERAGVTVRLADRSSLGTFFELHRNTASFKNFAIFPVGYFDYVWRMFAAMGKAQLFLAWHEDAAIAAILNMISGGRAYYGWGGMSRDPRHRKLMGNYLLHWTAMRWARDHGCSHYDLVGTSDFKDKLGGDLVQWPLPQRKFYGALGPVIHRASTLAWTRPKLRRGVDWVARRLRRPVPY
jgi:hypothetical protein